MKQGIHPQYAEAIKVTCSCGNTFETGSTVDELNIELCSQCHPFYTGKQKLVDTAKRVDKFEARVAMSKTLSQERKGKKVKAAEKAAAQKVKEDEKEK